MSDVKIVTVAINDADGSGFDTGLQAYYGLSDAATPVVKGMFDEVAAAVASGDGQGDKSLAVRVVVAQDGAETETKGLMGKDIYHALVDAKKADVANRLLALGNAP